MKLENPPVAYLITFTCYGTWLHGKTEGSVDRRRNTPGTDRWGASPGWTGHESAALRDPPYRLDARRREIVLHAALRVCRRRGWLPYAVHVRPTHVHAVVSGADDPDTMARSIKAFATHAIQSACPDEGDRRRWTRHASTGYLWDAEAVQAAVHYVLHEQGDPMHVYPQE